MRTKTCFVWTGLTSPGILLHPCVVCRPTLLGKSIHSQAGHPQAGASNPLPPKVGAQEGLGLICLCRSQLLFPTPSACVCVWVCLEREREREGE